MLMKKKIFFVIVAAVLLIAFFEYHRSHQEHWLRFQSDNPMLDFSFEYPASWTPFESRGRSELYDGIQMMGPRDGGKEFSVAYEITVKKSGNQSAQDLLADYVKRMERYPQFKTLKAGRLAEMGTVEYEYIMRLPLRKLNNHDVVMRGKALYVTRENRSYRINFFGTAEQFKRYVSIFDRAVKTLRFAEPAKTS